MSITVTSNLEDFFIPSSNQYSSRFNLFLVTIFLLRDQVFNIIETEINRTDWVSMCSYEVIRKVFYAWLPLNYKFEKSHCQK